MPATVLIVEDDRELRHYVQALLEKKGYRVVAAENGLQGFLEAAITPPDAVLMDLALPEMGGERAGKLIRERLPNVPICIVSGNPEIAEVAEALSADYLPKPFNDKALLEIVARLVDKH
jgi:two-component system KDP operon response regulator KdpE